MTEERQEKHGEFERVPVPISKTRGLKAFVETHPDHMPIFKPLHEVFHMD